MLTPDVELAGPFPAGLGSRWLSGAGQCTQGGISPFFLINAFNCPLPTHPPHPPPNSISTILGVLAVVQFMHGFNTHLVFTNNEIWTVHKRNPSCELGIVQELCESRGGRPGLSVLTSLLVSVDVKNY